MAEVSKIQLVQAIQEIILQEDFSSLTTKNVRRLAEEKLGLEKGYLNSRKDEIHKILIEVLREQPESKGESKNQDKQESEEIEEIEVDVEEKCQSEVESDFIDFKEKKEPRKRKRKNESNPDTKKRKKPMTAFLFYCKEYRLQVTHENPGASMPEISKILGSMWKELDQDGKKKYQDMADEEKRKFKDECGAEVEEKPKSKDEKIVERLKQAARKIKAGPHIYRNLSEMTPKEAVSVLQERLRSTGLLFNGQVPTQSEIEEAKRRKDKELALDGIDTSNIISERSRRRTSLEKEFSNEESNTSSHESARVENDVSDEFEFE